MARTVLKALNEGLHELFDADPRPMLIGEDLVDPYGGAFKVSKGLSTRFPDRVWSTPISEAGLVGVATGMAMRGKRPIAEIMFGDFGLLAADQLCNHAAKFRGMYAGKVQVPLVVRMPMGGRRGYGPTHSQSLEKHFMGMPGLVVVAIHPLVEVGRLLRRAVLDDDRPVLWVENKTMYARRLRLGEVALSGWSVESHGGPYPTLSLRRKQAPRSDVSLVAYGGMVEMALEAADELLIADEIYAEVVVPLRLSPLEVKPMAASVARSGALVVCEEASPAAGVGAEVMAAITEALGDRRWRGRRVGARAMPIANARTLERAILPQVQDLVVGAREVVQQSMTTQPMGGRRWNG